MALSLGASLPQSERKRGGDFAGRPEDAPQMNGKEIVHFGALLT
jgi:hypothetical protein